MLAPEEFLHIITEIIPQLKECARLVITSESPNSTEKGANPYDLLTSYDIELEERIITILSHATPGVAIVGEESGGDMNREEFWLVDPIDGTLHFTRHMPFCMTMVALIQNGYPVISVLINLYTGDVYHAVKGAGAYMNNQKIEVSKRHDRSSLVLVESSLARHQDILAFQRVHKSYKTMNLCCAGYEFCLVASGKVEARVVYNGYGKAYDFASGALLVNEAGGVVRNFHDEEFSILDTDFLAASNETLYYHLKSLIEGRE